jgi:radical SAM superfamily enzyme YgiQ (UPF0313 family)
MKITIINPNLSGCPSILEIGLVYLATYVNERSDHEAVILDFTFHRKDWKEHLKKHLETHKPDVIGFGTPTMYVGYIIKILDELKANYKKVPVICGGYNPTLNPISTLNIEGVDSIAIGDGEETLVEFLDAVRDKKTWVGIKGLFFKDRGNIIKNPLRDKIDISNLPFPNYDLLEDIDDYFFFLNQLYTIGMRGCPFNCTNCSDPPFQKATPGKRVRMLDPERYIAEIMHQAKKYPDKFDIVHCYDPTFTFDKAWVRKFCEEWKKNNLHNKYAFSVFARGDTLDEEIVAMLADANCKLVRMGIEAGSEEIRKISLHKNVTNKEIEDNVNLLHKYNIAITAFNMLGCPGERKKDLHATYNLIKKLKIDRPVFFIFRPLEGTEAEQMMEKSIIDYKAMGDITSLHKGAVLDLPDMTKKQIERFQLRCYLYFYTKRCLRLIWITKHRFFIDWVRYLIRGIRCQVPLFYIMGYFLHNYGKNGVN